MTAYDQPMTAREERRAKERAKIALIAALAPVVDLSTLSEGEHGFDYCVNVPCEGLHELGERIAEIEYDINMRFGVWARVLMQPRKRLPNDTITPVSST